MPKLKRNLLKSLVTAIFFCAASSLGLCVFAQSDQPSFNYTVREDDTFYLLARRFNSTIDKIASMNPQAAPENLRVGSKLKISAGSDIIVHPVMKGDTLWRIAAKYNTGVDAVAAKNYIDNPDLIFAGDILAVPESGQKDELMQMSKQVAGLFKNRDFLGLSKFAHPEKGVRFSPYAHVDVQHDVVFWADRIAKFSFINTKYTWGAYDGTGDPIILTPSQYIDRFVYGKDFAAAGRISFNQTIGKGNTLENQFDAYPKGSIVEYYVGGTEQYGHMDWQSLRLVFEKYNNKWYVVGVIHNEWTI